MTIDFVFRDDYPNFIMKMKIITKRHGKPDPVKDAEHMLKLVRQLRGDALIPRGVYRFTSKSEAHQWMIKKMADTRARLN